MVVLPVLVTGDPFGVAPTNNSVASTTVYGLPPIPSAHENQQPEARSADKPEWRSHDKPTTKARSAVNREGH